MVFGRIAVAGQAASGSTGPLAKITVTSPEPKTYARLTNASSSGCKAPSTGSSIAHILCRLNMQAPQLKGYSISIIRPNSCSSLVPGFLVRCISAKKPAAVEKLHLQASRNPSLLRVVLLANAFWALAELTSRKAPPFGSPCLCPTRSLRFGRFAVFSQRAMILEPSGGKQKRPRKGLTGDEPGNPTRREWQWPKHSHSPEC